MCVHPSLWDFMRRSWQVGPLILALASFVLTADGWAFDFEYIQTEKFYNTRLREEIEKDFFAGTLALEAEAKTLGMKVRKVDMRKLRQRLRERALLYANCHDRAIRAKGDNNKTDATAFAVRCVKEGLRIADRMQRKALSDLVPRTDLEKRLGVPPQVSEYKIENCLREAIINQKNVFDFLKDDKKDFVIRVRDFLGLKECIIKAHRH